MAIAIKKIQYSAFGGPEVVNLIEDTLPSPPPEHVQVKVLYSGFNGSDINMRNGTYPLQRKAPLTPGYCFVGTVHTNGSGCAKFQPGDVVACLSVYDAEATYTNQPEKYLVPVPRGVDYKTATALILDWNTALGMVKSTKTHLIKVERKRIFIHGMSGAVGYALMVLSRHILGEPVEIFGTASRRNHEAIRAFGATPFDYRDKSWIQAMRAQGGVHAVFDPLGFESWDESYSILCHSEPSVLYGYGGNLQTLNNPAHNSDNSSPKTRGVLVPTLKLLARNMKFYSHKSTVFYYITRDRPDFFSGLRELFDMVQNGEVEVSIKKVIDGLEEVPAVHRLWTSLQGMGSVVVKVA
jgi:synaptic vesicle membrane protein VAT-1